ncbi:hypothetical protein [Marinobacter phage PS6]|nr:hypothetical protein [Marinobacter phage PS6]
MNRRKFERFAEKQGLPLERLDNDTRYTSLETEWAWRGYCEKAEETRIASSTVNHLCNRAKPFMTRRNLGRFRQVIKDTVLTDALMPDSWKLVPFDEAEAECDEWLKNENLSFASPECWWVTRGYMKAKGYDWPKENANENDQ